MNEKDSLVYTFDNMSEQLFCYDFYGHPLDTVYVGETDDKGVLTMQGYSFSPYILDNHLYMEYFSIETDGTYECPEFFSKPIEAKYNLETGKLNVLNQTYPSNYQTYCYGFNFIPERVVLENKKFGYTFAYNDSLYVYDVESGEQRPYFFGTRRDSILIQHLNFEDLDSLNKNIFNSFYFSNPAYVFPVNLPLSAYVVRLLMTNNENKDNSLIILDKNYNYVGETPLGFSIGGVICDSNEGISILSRVFNDEENKFYLKRIKWKN